MTQFLPDQPAVVLGVEEDVTGVLNLLRQGIAPEDAGDAEQPEQLNISEIDRRLIRIGRSRFPSGIWKRSFLYLWRV